MTAKLRIKIDQTTCVGAGQCVLAAPAVFDQREEDGIVVLLADTADETQAAAVRKAGSAFSLAEPKATLPARVRRPARHAVTAKAAIARPMQEAKLTGLQSSAASNPAMEQQWIVLTTWEEAPGAAQQTADNAQAAGAATPQSGSRVTVTRLILRIIPPDSKAQPGTVPLRDGWLVIQL